MADASKSTLAMPSGTSVTVAQLNHLGAASAEVNYIGHQMELTDDESDTSDKDVTKLEEDDDNEVEEIQSVGFYSRAVSEVMKYASANSRSEASDTEELSSEGEEDVHILEQRNEFGQMEKKPRKSRSASEIVGACPVCGKTFKYQKAMEKHMQNMHAGVPIPPSLTPNPPARVTYSCPTCAKEYQSKQGLNIHMSTHSSERPFCCPTCAKRFPNSHYLKMHMKNAHHSTELGASSQVLKQQPPRGSSRRKRSLEERYPDAGTYMDPNDPDYDPLRPRKPSKMKFVCGVCDAKFRYREGYDTHMTWHDDVGRSGGGASSSSDKPFSCEVCPRKFMFQKHLEQHMRVHGVKSAKSVQTSPAQFEAMVCFMESNPMLALGHVGHMLATDMHNLWADAAEKLNDAEGPKRNPEQWQQVWNEFKRSTMIRAAAYLDDKTISLWPLEERMMKLMKWTDEELRKTSRLAGRKACSASSPGTSEMSDTEEIPVEATYSPSSDTEEMNGTHWNAGASLRMGGEGERRPNLDRIASAMEKGTHEIKVARQQMRHYFQEFEQNVKSFKDMYNEVKGLRRDLTAVLERLPSHAGQTTT